MAKPAPQSPRRRAVARPAAGFHRRGKARARRDGGGHAAHGGEHERIVKLEGISPGMTGGAMALMPDAPLLTALSVSAGVRSGGTSVWIQGSRFNTRTRVYLAGNLDTPGKGIMWMVKLDRVATHIPKDVMKRVGKVK